MTHYCRDVQLFQNKFGFDAPSDFIFIAPDLFNFRVEFFYEEFKEYKDSYDALDLGTAVDSLIDLVYIACGTAIYHGIGFDKFDDILAIPNQETLFPSKIEQSGVPHFLTAEEHLKFCTIIDQNILDYIDAYNNRKEKGIKTALASIYLNSLFASTQMDLTNEQWDEMWSDVQRANMSKERAISANQSKRGSTYDIVKGPNFVPPQSSELIKKYLKL